MASRSVRTRLERACEEIEDVCDSVPVSDSDEERLAGIAEQLRYLVEGDPTDPEAYARPDTNALDTIREHLAEITSEVEGDTATRLERARDDVLHAISVLDDRREKQREVRNGPE